MICSKQKVNNFLQVIAFQRFYVFFFVFQKSASNINSFQHRYIDDVHVETTKKHFHMYNCKKLETPCVHLNIFLKAFRLLDWGIMRIWFDETFETFYWKDILWFVYDEIKA